MTAPLPPHHPVPPDRSHILTEQRHPATMRLHEMSAEQLVELFNQVNAEVQRAMAEAAPAIAAFVRDAEPRFLAGGRLIYLGAGTSGRLGVLDASECPPTFQVPSDRVVGIIAGGDSALRVSSEGKEDDPRGAASELERLKLTPNDAVLGIAAGGTTPYVLGAIEIAKQIEPRVLTGMLSCSPVPKPAGADHLIVIPTGPELLTGSTRLKAGTATKLALNTISTTLMIRSGRVYQNLMVDLKATNDKLRDRAARIISTITGLSRPDALALLASAGGVVKTAIVMHTRSVDRATAEAELARNGGRLS